MASGLGTKQVPLTRIKTFSIYTADKTGVESKSRARL